VLGLRDELIDNVGPRPGLFVGHTRYALVRSFVEGFGGAKDDEILHGSSNAERPSLSIARSHITNYGPPFLRQ
jgi:hypothetical protein